MHIYFNFCRRTHSNSTLVVIARVKLKAYKEEEEKVKQVFWIKKRKTENLRVILTGMRKGK